MLTCRSPRKVLCTAFAFARTCLRPYSSKFSRRDYTRPQLFACVILREHQKKSFRDTETLLRDAEQWCHAIGMKRVPDHNTIHRAGRDLLAESRGRRLMDRLLLWMGLARVLGFTCAIDSTLYDTHHRSRHYEQRCRHYASSCKNTADSRRSRSARRTPKLSLCVDTRSHLILAARAHIGMGSDAPDFGRLLRQSLRRRPQLRSALADAGYDSHTNHHLARAELGVRSWIKTGAGRPSDKPPASEYRRLMKKKLKGSQKNKPYGQRAQVETVNSMMKRNLGDHLRAKTPAGRRTELQWRVLAHNISVLLRRMGEG